MSASAINPQATIPSADEDALSDVQEHVPGLVPHTTPQSPLSDGTQRLTSNALRLPHKLFTAGGLWTEQPGLKIQNDSRAPHEVLSLDWRLPHLLERVFRHSGYTGGFEYDDIYRIVSDQAIIHGDGNDFRCLTCKEYLEKTYGDDGQKALEIFVNTALAFGLEKGSKSKSNPWDTFHWISPQNRCPVSFKIPGNSRLGRIEEALRWLCAAMRISPIREKATRVADCANDFEKFEKIPSSSASIRFRFRNPQLHVRRTFPPEPSCWTSLFETGIITESPAPRTWGAGLEVSFSMMVSLAGVEHKYQIGTGVILLGFFTALVPISRHEQTNSIQWHLETNQTGIDPDYLNCTSSEWYRTMDMDVLTRANCFVGWFKKAHVMLGTRQLATDQARQIRWTQGLDFRKRTLELAGHEIGLQGGVNMGPINIAGQAISTWRYRINELRYSAPQQFAEALHLNRREVALVIDAESRRAWLVPLVSWILHLCHRYYVEHCDQGDTPIPFAERSSDGATATISAVKSKGDTVVFESGDSDPETLRQLWLRISTNLGVSRRDRVAAEERVMFAAEAMDIIMSRESSPTELPVSKGSASWVKFAKLAKTTTVCANLGNAILPVPPSGKLCECCTLLENEDFLAAHAWSLARLLEEKGSNFSQLEKDGLSFEDGTSWRVSRGRLRRLWTTCPAGAKCNNGVWGMKDSSSTVLQRAEKALARHFDTRRNESEHPLASDRRAFESGVFVFGGHGIESEGRDV